MNILFIDFETSGFPNKKIPAEHPDQAWVVEAAMILTQNEKIITQLYTQIKSSGRSIHPRAQEVHKISTDFVDKYGITEPAFCYALNNTLENTDLIVGHNVSFEIDITKLLFKRNAMHNAFKYLEHISTFCTMKETTNLCKLPGMYGKYKWPKLTELYQCLFHRDFSGAHNALADTEATKECYFELKKNYPEREKK